MVMVTTTVTTTIKKIYLDFWDFLVLVLELAHLKWFCGPPYAGFCMEHLLTCNSGTLSIYVQVALALSLAATSLPRAVPSQLGPGEDTVITGYLRHQLGWVKVSCTSSTQDNKVVVWGGHNRLRQYL